MCYKTSPAKLLRNVKRMAYFNEKAKENSIQKKFYSLCITILPPVNIVPVPCVKLLTFSKPINTNILPKKTFSLDKMPSISISPVYLAPKLSNINIYSTIIPPDPLPCFYCNLICQRPNLPPTPTRPIQMCYVCWKPIREDVEPTYCCNFVMHNLCWGDHECQN